MFKKILAVLLSVVTLGLCACGKGGDIEITVPEDTDVTLTINKEENNKTVFAVGTQLDPHFFAQNVGLNGYNAEYGSWTCKAEDWEIFEQRMTDMNLKRIRVMLLPSWFVIDETNTQDGFYNWETDEMHSLYRVLDTAKEKGMTVNITMWGIDKGTTDFMRDGSSEWVDIPGEGYEEMFVECFADCVKYLIEEKDYTNIKEVTLFNEPNAKYNYSVFAVNDYCDLCKMMDTAFDNNEIRDKVLFNLSDDARDFGWMANVLMQLTEEGVIDIANSHTYDFGDKYNPEDGTYTPMSNQQICYDNPTYNLNSWKMALDGYNIPHMWGEFGTRNGIGSHQTTDTYLPSRGLDVPRIALNFFNMGSVGMSYWVLFSQYYDRKDFNTGKIMDMGLWGFADENYNCRPVYYSFSMITRFIEAGDMIFPIESADDNIVAVAFRQGTKWSYAVVNNGTTPKKVAFANKDTHPTSLARYVYDEANVPTNNQVIPSNGTVTADGRVVSDTIAPRTFVIYTSK